MSDIEEENQSYEVETSQMGVENEQENTSVFDCPSTMLKHFAKGPFNPKKPLLQFVTNLDAGKKIEGGARTYKCHICNSTFKGSYTRIESHLTDKQGAGVRVCKEMNKFMFAEASRLAQEAYLRNHGLPIPKSTQASIVSSSSSVREKEIGLSSSLPSPTFPSKKRGNIAEALNLQQKERADDAVGRLFYAHALPFHLARSPYLRAAFEEVRLAGPSYVLPGETRLRTSILEKQYSRCSLMMQEMKATWVRSGCSIIMDGWTDIRQRPLINIMVSCSEGPYFLRAVDCSGKKKDAEFQFLLLKEAIEEVGSSNVVQVITLLSLNFKTLNFTFSFLIYFLTFVVQMPNGKL